jgi:hypothetical protein
MASQILVYFSPSFFIFLFSLLSFAYFVRALRRSVRGQ